jgi:phosphomannomutase
MPNYYRCPYLELQYVQHSLPYKIICQYVTILINKAIMITASHNPGNDNGIKIGYAS